MQPCLYMERDESKEKPFIRTQERVQSFQSKHIWCPWKNVYNVLGRQVYNAIENLSVQYMCVSLIVFAVNYISDAKGCNTFISYACVTT